MTLLLARDDEAFRLLQDPQFQARWDDLYSVCSWATAFQSYGFVSAWYESYRSVFSAFIAYELSAEGNLDGLLCLAIERNSKRIVVAGTHHAEYQTWMTRLAGDWTFVRAAFDAIREQSFPNPLVFRFLPADTPTTGLEGGVPDSWRFRFESRVRGIVPLSQEKLVASHLKSKREGRTNKYKLNKLKRLGEIRLERLGDPRAVALVLDDLICFYDLRQSATHGDSPFLEDPLKKAFHQALAGVPGLTHLTVMRAGNQLISGLFGVVGKQTLSLAMPMFSPIYADCSPMIWHVLMLVSQLREEGFAVFDLTPGSDPFKEEFTVTREPVRILTVFNSRSHSLGVTAKARGVAMAKDVLRKASVEPSSLKRVITLVSPSAIRNIVKSFSTIDETRLYALCANTARGLAVSTELRSGHFEDLLLFPLNSKARSSFIRDALKRLAKGQRIYTATDGARLFFVGWLSKCNDKVFFPEVGLEIAVSSLSLLLSSAYIAPGQETVEGYEKWVRQMTADAASQLPSGQILFSVQERDERLCSTLTRLGFVHQQSLFRCIRFGRVTSWARMINMSSEPTDPITQKSAVR